MSREHAIRLLVVAALVFFTVVWSRSVWLMPTDAALFVRDEPGVMVELGAGFAQPGMYQFSDGISLESVIKMTNLDCVSSESVARIQGEPPLSGEHLDLSCNDMESLDISRSWVSAAKRMTLGIPLRPERMSPDDWQHLPGIGPVLAARIEEYRQLNGEFVAIGELQRVRGIGPKRIEAWKEYFDE